MLPKHSLGFVVTGVKALDVCNNREKSALKEKEIVNNLSIGCYSEVACSVWMITEQ